MSLQVQQLELEVVITSHTELLFQDILLFYTEIKVNYCVRKLLSRYYCVFNDTYITETLILLRIVKEMTASLFGNFRGLYKFLRTDKWLYIV